MLKLKNLKMGLSPVVLTMCLFLIASNANAHQVWLERDADGPVRVYLGEPGVPDKGDKIDNLKGAHVFTNDRAELSVLSKKNDHWQADVGQGDVRLYTDKVWKPWSISGNSSWWKFWDEEPEKLQGAILQARAGRTETKAKLAYELVPVTAGGDVFLALFNGLPLAEQEVLVLSPSKQEVKLITDNDGKVNAVGLLTEQGLYVLESIHTVDVDAVHSGEKVSSLMYISTLSFVVN
jgi:uncharacterized GH25 family protein